MAEPAAPPEAERLRFVRLTEAPLPAVVALLNNARMHRHLPLAGEFSEAQAAAWVQAKDAQWAEHGYGPWAILVDGAFAGWGGFQREESGADFALVLDPAYWGSGAAITRRLLATGFGELGLGEVTIALPLTRNVGGIVARLGFEPHGEVSYGGVTFRQYRLTRERWLRSAPDAPARSRRPGSPAGGR